MILIWITSILALVQSEGMDLAYEAIELDPADEVADLRMR